MKAYTSFLGIVFMAALAFLTTGCHTIGPATVVDAAKLSRCKQYYVVVSANKDRGFRQEIERNLTDRGFTVNSGSLEEMGATEELYVTYEDRWTWDMVMYPQYVMIAISDAKTKELVGSAEFKNSAFHTFPDPPEITNELLGRIFGEPEGRYMK